MSDRKPQSQDGKSTRIDTFKSFSHQRPDPTTKPPVITPIQLKPPSESQKPQPKPSNTNSDN